MAYIGMYKNKDGKRLPSVTTILKDLGFSTDALMRWQAKIFRSGKDPDDIKNEAAGIGTTVHSMIEHWIFGQDEFIPDENVTREIILEAKKGFSEYIKWSEKNKVEYLESEVRLISEKYRYGGTADGIVRIDGKVYLLDFKTSKHVYMAHIAQLAAYDQAIKETEATKGYKIDGWILIEIKKGELEEGKERIRPHFLEKETIVDGMDMFKAALYIHKLNQKIMKVVRKINK